MKTYTADEWIDGASLECGVYWREADGSDVEVEVRDGAMYAGYGLRGSAAGTITVSGDGCGSVRRSGSGAGDAVRRGSGVGNACRTGDGEGFAFRAGNGAGNGYRNVRSHQAPRSAKAHEITWQNARKPIREAVYLELFNAMGVAQRATTGCADLGLQRLSARQQMLADAYSAAIDILRDAERASEDHNP